MITISPWFAKEEEEGEGEGKSSPVFYCSSKPLTPTVSGDGLPRLVERLLRLSLIEAEGQNLQTFLKGHH